MEVKIIEQKEIEKKTKSPLIKLLEDVVALPADKAFLVSGLTPKELAVLRVYATQRFGTASHRVSIKMQPGKKDVAICVVPRTKEF